MFKLNLKIAWRNLWKNKIYAAINIGGLALGLTAFVLMLLYINHEESYDKWSAELKNIYQIRERHSFFTPDNKEHWQSSNDSRMAALIRQNIPQAQAVTKVDQIWDFNAGYSVKIDHADAVMIKGIRDADSSFFKVFPFKFIQGNAETALIMPKSIVLKESVAIQLFGTTKVLGKTMKVIVWKDDPGEMFTVRGVVEEPKSPQTLVFSAIMRTGWQDTDPTEPSNHHYCEVYAKVQSGTDSALFNTSLQKTYVQFKKESFVKRKIEYDTYYKDGNKPGLKALSIADVHGNPPFEMSWFEKLKPIIGISIFLLLVSIINFVNLATAQSVQRAKEVGVRKVLGSYKRQLLAQFLMESALQSITALFLSIVFIEMALPFFNQNFNVTLSFWHNTQLLSILMQLFGLFLIVTLLAGFYPAWMVSKYNPVSVLKGNYESGLRGIALRNTLVVFQFIISVTFMIAIGIMHRQTRFMMEKDLGFERANLINIRTNYNEKFADRLRRIPGVKSVATTTQLLGNVFNNNSDIAYNGHTIPLNTVTISMDALQTLGAKLVSGRLFSRAYKQDTVNAVILNESAAKLLDKQPIGKMFDLAGREEKYTFQVVGVIKDYHNEGFDKAVLPTMYKVTKLGGTSMTNNVMVKFDSDNSEAILKKIKAEWNLSYPEFPMAYTSMDDAFWKVMEANDRFIRMIVLFSTVSISLSLLGLFALSTFVAKRRTKEVAVRKVLGASDFQIINLLNRSFLILVITANIISWPIAYILVKKWLQGFAYRIDMPIFPFLLATIVSVIIAVLTVSIQARKAAVADPVNALKYE
ncbi:ABC transporter permease [Pedobacter sp. AW1-32]|uniref:ABC transporter permease n=1 Tax=Pedobacter sp. AW1-32 TaxID=3383026 RepID=UPI003FEEDC12